MTPQVLYNFPECAGKSFMPSTGSEGMVFEEAFCANCIHEKFMHTQSHADKQCEVFNRVWLNAPNPQPEWQFNEDGWPVCTEWVKWDWDKDDDGNWNDPVLPDPISPDQLNLFPLYPNEKDFQEHLLCNEAVAKGNGSRT